MANKRSDWNDCLFLAAQLKQQSLTAQPTVTSKDKYSEESVAIEQALEKLRLYQGGIQGSGDS